MTDVADRLARRLELDPDEFAYVEALVAADDNERHRPKTRHDPGPSTKSVACRVLAKIREAR